MDDSAGAIVRVGDLADVRMNASVYMPPSTGVTIARLIVWIVGLDAPGKHRHPRARRAQIREELLDMLYDLRRRSGAWSSF